MTHDAAFKRIPDVKVVDPHTLVIRASVIIAPLQPSRVAGMSERGPIRIGIAKVGNIGTSVLLDILLDERAEREDIVVRVVGSGPKLTPEEVREVVSKLLEFKPDLVLVASPNAALPGPSAAREMLAEAGVPTIVITDSPGKKAVKDVEAKGMGYIIVPADSMIGARREFLDPTEMAIYNADLVKVLACTGVFHALVEALDRVIAALKAGEGPELPRLILDRDKAVEAARFANPYARAKAMAAYEMAAKVADLTVEGCFKVKEWERYTHIVAAAHELMREAARLADEAREMEKQGDTVFRAPHNRKGVLLRKEKLIEKPRKPEGA